MMGKKRLFSGNIQINRSNLEKACQTRCKKKSHDFVTLQKFIILYTPCRRWKFCNGFDKGSKAFKWRKTEWLKSPFCLPSLPCHNSLSPSFPPFFPSSLPVSLPSFLHLCFNKYLSSTYNMLCMMLGLLWMKMAAEQGVWKDREESSLEKQTALMLLQTLNVTLDFDTS